MASAVATSTSTSPVALRDWVAATNRSTRRFFTNWWIGNAHHSSSSQISDLPSRPSSSPSPVVVAAICAPDTEERPVESAPQFCYTSYDSDDGGSDEDEELQLELLKRIAMADDEMPPSWGASQAAYFMYSSQKSGSAA